MKAFDKRIYLACPTMHGDELKYMTEAYTTNWMSTLGANVDAVEKIGCDVVGKGYAVALSSGTSALHLAVKLAGVKPREKVFVTDMTFSATVNPIVYEQGEPIFIDSEADTWNMDPRALERAFELYPEVRVVMLVHLYGTPAKLDEIKAICEKHNAILIEDAAESLGATYRGTETGNFGEYSVISFNGNKIITGSSGGMLLTDDENAAKLARKWSTQSRDAAPWYQHTQLGYNYRMSNVIAGVVRGQFPYLCEHIARKKAIYETYKTAFADLGLPVKMNPYEEDKMEPNFWLSCLIIDKEAMCRQDRTDCEATFVSEYGKSCPTEILEALAAANAEGRPIWKPMHMQPIYSEKRYVTVNELRPTCEDIFERGLCLPSDIKMTEAEQRAIIEIIKNCFRGE